MANTTVYKVVRREDKTLRSLCAGRWSVDYVPNRWTECPQDMPLFAFRSRAQADAAAKEARDWCKAEVWKAEVQDMRACLRLPSGDSYCWPKFWRGELEGELEAPTGTVIVDKLRLLKRVWPEAK